MAILPYVPSSITVHLGIPSGDSRNVTLPFLDYIANVASSEIYPTWDENALRANILAETSFALNRIYTEYYRAKGYAFDITSSTAYDQAFVYGREIFENIYELASELFTTYIRRENSVEPLFAQYCNGTTVTCNGLSQWGTVDLARLGYTPMEILRYYYGNDIVLEENAPIRGNQVSLPKYPLTVGSVGDDVRTLQIRLNRVSSNFPSIPKILLTDGIFGTDTEQAVRTFQTVFHLTVDGIVGRETWYTLQNLYTNVKRLTELDSEGIRFDEVTQQYPSVLKLGSHGIGVYNLQYYINFLSQYYSTIPPVALDGSFGPLTRAAVIDVQNTFGLSQDGIVGENTWNSLYNAYLGIIRTIPVKYTEGVTVPYGGVPLRIGADSDSVLLLQQYLNYIAKSYPEIPTVNTTGYFGTKTRSAVISFQKLYGLNQTGVVEAATWNAITSLYENLYLGAQLQNGQFPGYEVG